MLSMAGAGPVSAARCRAPSGLCSLTPKSVTPNAVSGGIGRRLSSGGAGAGAGLRSDSGDSAARQLSGGSAGGRCPGGGAGVPAPPSRGERRVAMNTSRIIEQLLRLRC